jgi:hypothetical protein
MQKASYYQVEIPTQKVLMVIVSKQSDHQGRARRGYPGRGG